MENNITFSICIPNFNYANYIGETLDSILNQTFQDFEIIIVDNASTDNSWNIIQNYALKDNRIKAFRNHYNVGFAPNLDKAAQIAKGNFIIMLSADDTMNVSALAEYNIIVSNKNIDNKNILLASATNIIDSNGIKTGIYTKNKFHQIPLRGKYNEILNDDLVSDYNGLDIFNYIFPRFGVPGPFNSTLYSKEMYEKVGGYASINLIGPDGHFANKCLLIGAELIFIDKPLFNYRIHNSGQLQNAAKKQNINILIDRYIFSNAYSDEQLSSANLNRIQFIDATIETDCLKGGLSHLKNGEWVYAFQHLMFALAAYPNRAIKNKKTFLFAILLLLGPIGIMILKMIYKLKKNV